MVGNFQDVVSGIASEAVWSTWGFNHYGVIPMYVCVITPMQMEHSSMNMWFYYADNLLVIFDKSENILWKDIELSFELK